MAPGHGKIAVWVGAACADVEVVAPAAGVVPLLQTLAACSKHSRLRAGLKAHINPPKGQRPALPLCNMPILEIVSKAPGTSA